MIYTIYLREMSNNLLCECMRVCRFVWGCINMWLKRGSRFKYGVKKNHMITYESVEFIFKKTNIGFKKLYH